MKKELTNIIYDFIRDVDLQNARRTDVFEDDIEYTFANFAKWLDSEEEKEYSKEE